MMHQYIFSACHVTKVPSRIASRIENPQTFFVLHSITCKSVHLSHTTPFAQGLKGTIKPALKVT